MVYLFSMIVVGSVCYFVGKFGPEQFVQKIKEQVEKVTKSLNK